jgi:hypothetical protein
LNAVDARLAMARLAVFAAAVFILFFSVRGLLSFWALAAPAAAFAALVTTHDRLLRRRDEAIRAVAFYERSLARIEDRWAGGGEFGDRFRDEHHLYANDLDLFGRGSLFELLSTARTQDGEARLAAWLLAPASAEEIAERQGAVAELAQTVDLRERMAVAGDMPAIDTRTVVAWAEAPPSPILGRLRVLAFSLAGAVAVTTAYLAATGDLTPLLVVLIVEFIVFRGFRQRMEQELHLAGRTVRDLDALSELLALVQTARFTTTRLVSLASALEQHGIHAAAAIKRLHRISEFHDWQHSLPILPVVLFLAGSITGVVAYVWIAIAVGAVMLLWSPFLTLATEAWRKEHGDRVRAWVGVVAEIEALASLSAYHYEHPSDPFPDLIPFGSPAHAPGWAGCFDGRGLGHPLLPAARTVTNDVRLTSALQLVVVSGSNMSGKSTLLRTVGVNAVMALAGAPVRAASLRISPLTVGATLRIQDSLQEGRSRFYAEITRIRELSDAANGPAPLLFLLDELFHGTNSHDRLVGASGVLRSLLDRGAIGLITTHDLALTAIADQLAPRAANIHFEDSFDGGEIRFDYLARPGPVTKSNALALMRAVGLDVPPA